MNHEIEQLSPAGMQRRDQMLADLKGHMRTLHHRRRVRRSVVVAGSMALFFGSILTSVWLLSKDRAAPPVNQIADGSHGEKQNAVASLPAVIVEMVQTDPGIVVRWRAQPAPQWVLASDDELLESLAAANKQTGLIRSGSRVWLTNDVTTETTPPASDSSSGGIPSPSVARAKSKPSPRG